MPLQEELEVQGNYLFRYRGVLPISILVAGIIVFLVCDPHPFTDLTWKYELICLGVSLLGLAIRVLTVAFRFKGTSGRNTEKQVAEHLNTTGIYSQVRHPLYLGNFFMSLGLALLVRNYWFLAIFIGVYWIYYERIMFAEEQFLRKRFGEKYLRWASVTPAIIPAFQNWVKPETRINWWGAVRNEITCLLSLIAVFFAFEIIEKFELGKLSAIFANWQLYAVSLVLMVYVLVKVIRKLEKRRFRGS
jgi:protein-S-isoprenylcysteine O-methyltransferase Ste14